MKKLLIIAAAVGVIGLVGCQTGPSPADSIIAEAKKEMKVAKSMNFLWRDTGKILKKAEKARDDGDDAKAVKLAKKALFQAQQAQKQAKAQANPRVRYPRQ